MMGWITRLMVLAREVCVNEIKTRKSTTLVVVFLEANKVFIFLTTCLY
jgi:hypothetical protein